MYRFAIHEPDFLPHLRCEIELLLKKGELTTIVGENGIGKSTLIRYLKAREATSIAHVEQISMDFFFDRRLDKIKSIYLESEDVDREAFLTYWHAFHLDQKEQRYLSTLSGGESQSLKLSLALAVKRDIYILDEPSQYLDERSKQALNNILQNLLKQNRSVLVIEHDLTWMKIHMQVHELVIDHQVLRKGKSWTI